MNRTSAIGSLSIYCNSINFTHDDVTKTDSLLGILMYVQTLDACSVTVYHVLLPVCNNYYCVYIIAYLPIPNAGIPIFLLHFLCVSCCLHRSNFSGNYTKLQLQ